jgi:RimJ/RimL family protein N-acetyltransferase
VPRPSRPRVHGTGGLSVTHDEGAVVLLPMADTEDSFRRLAAWFTDPAVRRFYRAPTHVDEVRAKYWPRTQAGARIRALTIFLDATPVGYAQYYRLRESEILHYGLDGAHTWGGFDLLIGVPSLWGRGIGRQAVQHLLSLLQQLPVAGVAIDTDVDNVRARRLYGRFGFHPGRRLPGEEDGHDHLVLWRWLGSG